MGVKQVIKKGFSIGFQPKRWLGVEQVAQHGKTCVNLLTGLVKPGITPEQQAEQQAAAQALQQDVEALNTRQRLAGVLCLSYFLAGLVALCYAIFLVWARALWLPAAVMVMVSLILYVYALRELMVYGQIRCGGERLPLKVLLKKMRAQLRASS